MTDAKYFRVYWSVIDDESFNSVYDDDGAFALWLRLSLIADQAWPASAHLPARHRKAALKTLMDANLVELNPGGRYRIPLLNAERERRNKAASIGARARWPGNSANEHPLDSERTPTGAGARIPRRDEQRRDEQRRDEQRRDEEGSRSTPRVLNGTSPVVAWLTQRGIRLDQASRTGRALLELIDQHGEEAVLKAMQGLPLGLVDAPQYVFGAWKSLNPIPGSRPRSTAKGYGPSAEEVANAFDS